MNRTVPVRNERASRTQLALLSSNHADHFGRRATWRSAGVARALNLARHVVEVNYHGRDVVPVISLLGPPCLRGHRNQATRCLDGRFATLEKAANDLNAIAPMPTSTAESGGVILRATEKCGRCR